MSPWDSLDSWSNYSSHPPANLEEVLYQHWQHWRRVEQPHQLIERFRKLFLDVAHYPDSTVANVLIQLSCQSTADREFKYVLNRCCYTLINPWYTESRNHWAIPELVQIFDNLPEFNSLEPENQRIQALVREFVASEQYAALCRLQKIFSRHQEPETTSTLIAEQPLGYRIQHYPFLYDSSLLTKDSGQEQKQNISDLRRKTETDLAIRLARYQTHRQAATTTFRVVNPTLLDEPRLEQALTYYTGKVDGRRSHRDQAHWFATYSKTVRSYRDFKDEFVDYLINPIASAEPKYSNNYFTRNLRQYLRETLVEFDGQPLNSFIVVETCRRLLNFLVVDSPKRPVFRNFCHLVNDVGYALTMGLLLRVVLFCTAAKPWLERCFSVLFNVHERRYCKEVPWLVTSLEHANVALITNFSDVGYQF